MVYAKLRQESVNRSNLYPGTATAVSQYCGRNMILAIGHQQRYGGKPIQNLRVSFRTREPLKKLLEDKARGKDRLA
jgi:hypothetical protein